MDKLLVKIIQIKYLNKEVFNGFDLKYLRLLRMCLYAVVSQPWTTSTSLGGHDPRFSVAYPSSVANKAIECKYVETKSALFFIEGQGIHGCLRSR